MKAKLMGIEFEVMDENDLELLFRYPNTKIVKKIKLKDAHWVHWQPFEKVIVAKNKPKRALVLLNGRRTRNAIAMMRKKLKKDRK